MNSSNNRLGSWVVIAVLLLLLVLAVVYLFVGWGSVEGDAGQQMSGSGYVAMAFGIVVTLALGVGLMALMFYSSRQGHD